MHIVLALALVASLEDEGRLCLDRGLSAEQEGREADAIPELRCACEAKIASGCVELGRMFERAGNPVRAKKYLDAAKALGTIEAGPVQAPRPSVEPAEKLEEAPRKVVTSPPRHVLSPLPPRPAPELGRFTPTVSFGYTAPLTAASEVGPAPLGGSATSLGGIAVHGGLRCRLGGQERCEGEVSLFPAIAATVGYERATPYETYAFTARFEVDALTRDWAAMPSARVFAFASAVNANALPPTPLRGGGLGVRAGIGVGFSGWSLAPLANDDVWHGVGASAVPLAAAALSYASIHGVDDVVPFLSALAILTSPQLELYYERVEVGVVPFEGMRLGVAFGI